MNNLANFAVVVFINILAYWHKDRVLYILAGLASILYGFAYWPTAWYLSLLLVLTGICSFIKAWAGREEA